MFTFWQTLDTPLALLLTGAILGGIVQGISGFAFGMVGLSIWAWGINPREATVMAVFGGLCGQMLLAATVQQRTKWGDFLPFLIGGLLGVPIGTYLLPFIGATQFKLLLGVLLAIGSPLMLLAPRSRYIGAVGRTGDAAAGVAGGVIGGISGLTGIAPAIWCALRGYDRMRQRQLLQNFNLATLAATMLALTWNGVVTRPMVPHLAIVAAAMIIPTLLGVRVYRRMSDAAFRRVVLILLTLAGVALVASAV